MASEDQKVECQVHGQQTATYVCQHLLTGTKAGVSVGYDPDNPFALYPDAWCMACELLRAKSGEWTDEATASAEIKLLCSGCYMDACDRNWIEDSDSYDSLINDCVQQLQLAQDRLIESFNLNDWERWDWDMERQELVFSHEGRRRVVARVAFVGTYSTKSSTWMWAWGNESLPHPVRSAMGKVRSAGEETGFRRLTLGHWSAEECDGWHMTAYAHSVLGGLGAYRTASDNSFVHMVILDATRYQ